MTGRCWQTRASRSSAALSGAALALALSGCASIMRSPASAPSGAASSVTARAFAPSDSPADLAASGLPPSFAPGAIDPRVTQANIASTICRRGYTATVRPPESYTTGLKRQQMAALGLPGSTALYEEDHRIPLEVGGDPTDQHNLWPEVWDGLRGAHAKDEVENAVHAAVCSGRMTLAQGQSVFFGDWWTG